MATPTSKKTRNTSKDAVMAMLPKDARIVLPTLEENHSMSVGDAQVLLEGITNTKQQRFLLALAQLGNRTRAAQAVSITTVTVWEWRQKSEDFEIAFQKAMEIASDLHEDELIRRGTEGVVEPVFQGGNLVGSVRRYDTVALIVALKGSKPDKYRENIKIEHGADAAIVAALRNARTRALGQGNNE